MERFTPGMPEIFRYSLQFPLKMGIANGMPTGIPEAL